MGAESAATGGRFRFSGAPELASAADSPPHLQIYAHVPGGHSYFVVGHGQRTSADNADQAANPLSHVLILRALRQTAQIRAHCRARISRQNRRNIGCKTSHRSEGAPEGGAATINLRPASAMPALECGPDSSGPLSTRCASRP